jgi:hypothetical protein
MSAKQSEVENVKMPTTSQGLDCNRVTLHGILSQFTSIRSIKLVVDNPKSSYPRQLFTKPTSEDLCRWSTAPPISRKNSMENLQGLGLPKRPSQENFAMLLEEAFEIQDQLEGVFPAHCNEDEDMDSSLSTSDRPLDSRSMSPHSVHESEDEWSDMFHSDCYESKPWRDEETKESKDADLSAALISTIERLAISAALALSHKRQSLNHAMTLMDCFADTSPDDLEQVDPVQSHSQEEPQGYRSSSTEDSSDESVKVVCSAVRDALAHNWVVLDPITTRQLVLTEAVLQEVDRIAVRAALTLTSAQDCTD